MRRPFALANWKMAMTIAEAQAYVAEFLAAAGDRLPRVEVVLCPPCTALHTLAQALRGWPAAVGAQNVSAHEAGPHTGQVPARLLADAGCDWVMLGHWEVRRELGDDDALVNRKAQRALQAGLRPVFLVGEALGRREAALDDLSQQLPALLDGLTPADVGASVFLYEPEWTVGRAEPAPRQHVEAGCRAIRAWLRLAFGPEAAEAARIIYGGSVSPEYAEGLLQAADVDGLGAGRRGLDPQAWASIVRLIAQAKAW